MRILSQPLYNHPKYAKLIEWGKLITITGSAQVAVQAIGLISGILVIRLLPTQEYALYTLANTMLGTMTLLADGGISTGVMAQGGKVWQDREKLGSVLVTGLDLRKKFAAGSLLIAIPILLYLLLHHGASWVIAILILIAIIPAFYSALSNAQLQIAPKLHQNIAPLQNNQLITNLARLAGLCLTLFLLPYAFVAIAIASLPQIWSNLHLKKISASYVDWKQKIDLTIKSEILHLVKRMLPGIIYYCLSGQITIWLISITGSTAAVAQIGALGRLAMLLNVFTIIFSTLIVPRYARISEGQSLLNKFIQIQIGLLILCLALISIFWLFPSEMLWVLGKNYSNLEKELVLNIIGSCISLMAGSAFLLYSSRGWSLNQLISIPVNVAAVFCGTVLFKLSTLNGILLLNIFVATVQLLMHLSYATFTIVKLERTRLPIKLV